MTGIEKDIGVLLNDRVKWSDQGIKALSLDPNIYVNDQIKVEISNPLIYILQRIFHLNIKNCRKEA